MIIRRGTADDLKREMSDDVVFKSGQDTQVRWLDKGGKRLRELGGLSNFKPGDNTAYGRGSAAHRPTERRRTRLYKS